MLVKSINLLLLFVLLPLSSKLGGLGSAGNGVIAANSAPDAPSAAAASPVVPPSDPFGDFEDPTAPPPSPIPADSPISSSPAGTAQDRSETKKPFTGKEYRWRNLVFRPSDLKYEPYFLLAIGTYILLSFLGRRQNSNIATSFLTTSYSFLQTQFQFVGTGNTEGNYWKAGGYKIERDSDNKRRWWGWATGRRGTDGVEVRVECEARDDLIGWAYQWFYEMVIDPKIGRDEDKATFTFKLKPASDNAFVWSLMKKGVMGKYKNDRYDLRAFATRELQIDSVHPELIVFSEIGELNENLVKLPKAEKVGILELFSGLDKEGEEAEIKRKNFEWFESLILTDIGAQEPSGSDPELPTSLRALVLTVKIPPEGRMEEVYPSIMLACNIVDLLDSTSWKLNVSSMNKLKAIRSQIQKDLTTEAKKEEKEEAEEKKRAERKKLEEEKYARMSPAEQKKYDEQKKRREVKKAQGKMTKRM